MGTRNDSASYETHWKTSGMPEPELTEDNCLNPVTDAQVDYGGTRHTRTGYGSQSDSWRTYLAVNANEVPNHEDIAPLDNPVTLALNTCRQKVVRPYKTLLKVIAWHPLSGEADTYRSRVYNVLHVALVVLLVLTGYFIQYAACFRRERGVITHNLQMHLQLEVLGNGNHNHTTDITPRSTPVPIFQCKKHIISQFIIPDILHSLAYVYGFYLLRISQCEQLETLMEMVFLQSSPNHAGYQSQGKLIRNLRLLLYGGVTWVFLSLASQVMHIAAGYTSITFTWMSPHDHVAKGVLLFLMLVGFVALDMVYLCVVISYCVQCSLLVYYMRGLKERVLERTLSLEETIKKIGQFETYLQELNNKMSNAVSLVLFNFITMAVLGLVSLMDRKENEYFSALTFVSVSFALILWMTMWMVPIIQACMVSGACNTIRKLGHDVRVRPFGFTDTAANNLDSFIMFTATLNMRAKLFRIPIRASYVMFLVITVCLLLLLAFQLGTIEVWL